MDPTGMTASAAIGTLLSIAAGVIAYVRYKRGKREKIAQAEADELGKAIVRADTGNDPGLKLRVSDKEE